MQTYTKKPKAVVADDGWTVHATLVTARSAWMSRHTDGAWLVCLVDDAEDEDREGAYFARRTRGAAESLIRSWVDRKRLSWEMNTPDYARTRSYPRWAAPSLE